MEEILKKARSLWQDGNEKEAIALLSQKNMAENGAAYTMIGEMYECAERGHSNIKRDYKKAREYFKKGLSLGDACAGEELGDLYYFGNGVKENYKLAEKYWRLAHEMGSVIGTFKLANLIYDHFQSRIDEAIILYLKLIEQNEFVGNSAFRLSEIYGRGLGVERSLDLKFKYLDVGVTDKHGLCCNELAVHFYNGDGVDKNLNKAIDLLKIASESDSFGSLAKSKIEKMKAGEKVLM